MNMPRAVVEGNASPQEFAEYYVSLGLGLLTVRPLTKAPTETGWQTKDPVTDPAAARILFSDPDQNVGLKPGDLFAVIDVDIKRGGKGRESFEALSNRLGPLPRTAEFISPSGGAGLLFRVRPGAGLTTQSRMLGFPDLEFRTGGSHQCLLPPSRFRGDDGAIKPYRWREGHEPWTVEIADLPEVVIQALATYEPETQKANGTGLVAAHLATETKGDRPTDDRLPELAPILEGCNFLRSVDENAASGTVTESAWYAVLSITARCRDGERLSHLISAADPRYSAAETRSKIDQALRASGPRTCANILDKLGFAGCHRCPFQVAVKSPISLGQLPPKPRDPRTPDVTASALLRRVRLQKTVVYDAETDRVFHPETGLVERAKTFAATVRHKVGRNVIDTLLSWPTTPRAPHFDYRAGDRRLFIDGACNTWAAGGVEPVDDPDAAAPILNHLLTLIPHDVSREFFLDYLAHLLQRPSVKIKCSIIVTGDEGFGKSTITDILMGLFGKKNVENVGGKQLSSRFKESLVNRQVIVVEEANHGERYEVTEDLKQWFTGETFPVEGKGIPFFEGRTPRGIFIFSNKSAPLVITTGSRRFMVMKTVHRRPDAAYFGRLYAALEDPATIGSFKSFLLARDVSNFNPHAEPPRTEAREEAEQASLTPLGEKLADMISKEAYPLHRDIVCLSEIATKLQGETKRKIGDVLKSLGAVKVLIAPDGTHRQITLPGGKPLRLWAIRNQRHWQDAEEDAVRAEFTRLPPAENVTSFYDAGLSRAISRAAAAAEQEAAAAMVEEERRSQF